MPKGTNGKSNSKNKKTTKEYESKEQRRVRLEAQRDAQEVSNTNRSHRNFEVTGAKHRYSLWFYS